MSIKSFYSVVLLLPLVFAGCFKVETEPAKTEVEVSKTDDDPWAGHTQGLPFEFGFIHGIEQAQKQKKPVMFFITNTRCGWCKKLASESFTDADVKSLLDQFLLIIVDSDDRREHPVLAKLGVDRFPFIIFKSHEGETLAVAEGYKPKDEFEDIVVQAVNTVKHNEANVKADEKPSSEPAEK